MENRVGGVYVFFDRRIGFAIQLSDGEMVRIDHLVVHIIAGIMITMRTEAGGLDVVAQCDEFLVDLGVVTI